MSTTLAVAKARGSRRKHLPTPTAKALAEQLHRAVAQHGLAGALDIPLATLATANLVLGAPEEIREAFLDQSGQPRPPRRADRRSKVFARYEVTNWKDLPPEAEPMAPIVVIVDELSGLFYPEKIPKGLPKDSPLVLEPMEINLQKAVLEKHTKKTAAELRFVGIKLVLSTQVASTTTGIDTSLRMNLGNKLLLGSTRPTATGGFPCPTPPVCRKYRPTFRPTQEPAGAPESRNWRVLSPGYSSRTSPRPTSSDAGCCP